MLSHIQLNFVQFVPLPSNPPSYLLCDIQLFNDLCLHSAQGDCLTREMNVQWYCMVKSLTAQVHGESKAHGECSLHVPAIRSHLPKVRAI